jgi:hypothetical protein
MASLVVYSNPLDNATLVWKTISVQHRRDAWRSFVLPIKQITLCLLAVFALSAVLASAASAASPAWWVEGSLLAAGKTEAVAETTTVAENFVVKDKSFGVECTSVQLEKTSIEGEKTAKLEAIVLKGCKDLTQSHCEVATIKTNPLTATLEGTSEHFKLNFKPTKGESVATVHFSGSECTFSSIVLHGSMACNYPKVESEAVIHELEFTASSGSKLEALGEEVELRGFDDFWLKSEKKWSVH